MALSPQMPGHAMASLAAMQRRMKMGKTAAATEGRIMGRPAFGFARDPRRPGLHLIVPEQAAVVRDLFEYVVGGATPPEVARRLDSTGALVPGSKDVESSRGWNARMVRSIVSKPIYAGLVDWGRTRGQRDLRTFRRSAIVVPRHEWIVTEVGLLAIVSREVWDGAPIALGSSRSPVSRR